MRSALQNLRTFGIMDVYLRQGSMGSQSRVAGDRESTSRPTKAPRNAYHVVDCSMSHGLLQQHLSIQN
jgi:hypothetical protein